MKFKSQQKTIFILAFLYFSTAFCRHGLYLTIVDHSKNIFRDSIISCIGEIISLFSSCYIAEKHGRIFLLKYAGLIGGISYFLFEFIDNKGLKTICFLLISFCFSAATNVTYIYSPEVLPTLVRSTVIGYLSLLAKFAAVTVPILFWINLSLPIVLSVFAFVSCYLSSLLTETLGKEMSDIIPELAVKRRQSFLSTSNASIRRHTITHIRRMTLNKMLLTDDFLKIEK